jgi:hypothetical protein
MNFPNQNQEICKSKDEYVKSFLDKIKSIPDTPEGNLEVSRITAQFLTDGVKGAVKAMKASQLDKKPAKDSKKPLEI